MTVGTSDRDTRAPDRPRAKGLGVVSGLVAIGCCVYPIVLVLLGIATAVEAVALATDLFNEWGWAFKIGGAMIAVAGVVIQLRRRGQCSVKGARSNWTYIARVAIIGTAVYFVLYGVTTALGEWGTPD